MKNREDSQRAQPAAGIVRGSPGRKPYRKPAFRHERVFETQALTCGKVGFSQFSCKHNHKVS
jgi:hypothetical protein